MIYGSTFAGTSSYGYPYANLSTLISSTTNALVFGNNENYPISVIINGNEQWRYETDGNFTAKVAGTGFNLSATTGVYGGTQGIKIKGAADSTIWDENKYIGVNKDTTTTIMNATVGSGGATIEVTALIYQGTSAISGTWLWTIMNYQNTYQASRVDVVKLGASTDINSGNGTIAGVTMTSLNTSANTWELQVNVASGGLYPQAAYSIYLRATGLGLAGTSPAGAAGPGWAARRRLPSKSRRRRLRCLAKIGRAHV